MTDNIKFKLMCFVTAASVALGSLAAPVAVWADDDDDDYILVDLDDLSDDEINILSNLSDKDGDGDIDEHDVDAIATAFVVAAIVEAEHQQEAAALEAQRQAQLAQAAELEAQKKAQAAQAAALEAQKKELEKKQKEKVSGIWISTTDISLSVGQTYQVFAGVKPDTAKNKSIRFSSSEPGVVSIDASGIVRGNSVGSCYITATSDDGGYQARACVRVNPSPAVAAQTVAQDANWTSIAANMILTAAPGQVLNLVAPKAMSFDAGMINALKMRPDVGLLVAYPYNGHTYVMAVPAGYNLAARMDKSGKVSFLSLAAVKDGKIVVQMTQ